MDKERIIELLNKDVEDEHGAIIQYLSHAYAIGEGEMTCEIEALAREEMRHLDWLAETIVELGGIPSIRRGTMNMTGTTVSDWMASNVGLEEGAIAQYREHIKAIDDPKIKRLLRRILSDEESHHGDFQHFVEKAMREGMADLRGTQSDKTTEILNWGIKHEYTVILQYLLQSYLTPNEEASKELEDQAINEMQHLGWLAEEIVGVQGKPVIEHSEVDRTTDTADMLRADIKIENEVADVYDRTAGETTDTGIKKLMLRLRDHEKYHAEVFGDLLKEEETKG
ncbi:MAG TPA: ferritin-like domain-containing protein [Dehalococcoidia bacterium]|nr:ferritin-like domain-containing protein [Dehalococcoidia bacterium]